MLLSAIYWPQVFSAVTHLNRREYSLGTFDFDLFIQEDVTCNFDGERAMLSFYKYTPNGSI